jgi:hypothetical protein
MSRQTARNSMRTRLILIPSMILALGIVAAIGATLYGARAGIVSEIDSGLTLGDHLIGYALDDLAASIDHDAPGQSAALQRLRESPRGQQDERDDDDGNRGFWTVSGRSFCIRWVCPTRSERLSTLGKRNTRF